MEDEQGEEVQKGAANSNLIPTKEWYKKKKVLREEVRESMEVEPVMINTRAYMGGQEVHGRDMSKVIVKRTEGMKKILGKLEEWLGNRVCLKDLDLNIVHKTPKVARELVLLRGKSEGRPLDPTNLLERNGGGIEEGLMSLN